MKKKRPTSVAFDYAGLVPEMQYLVRAHCLPSARAMLGMTCRGEQECIEDPKDKTHLFMYLAYEGDELGWLRTELKERRERNQHDFCYKANKASWYYHQLLEECVRGGHLELLQFIHETYKECTNKACDQCVLLAVATGNHPLVKYVIDHCGHGRHSAWGPHPTGASAIATAEAVRRNDMDLLRYLKQEDRFDDLPDFEWDPLRCHGDPSFFLDDCREAVHWFIAQIEPEKRQTTHYKWCLRSLFRELLKGMIYLQWPMDHIRHHIENNMEMELRCIWHEGTRFWFKLLLAHGLQFENADVIHWAMNKCWSHRHEIDHKHLIECVRIYAKDEKRREEVLAFFSLPLS